MLHRMPVIVLTFLGSAFPLAAQQLGPFGNTAGFAFSDSCDVAGITVRAGWWVDGVQVHCRDAGDRPHRGGLGGGGQTFWLEPGERIVGVQGSWSGPAGQYIYALQFITDRRTSPVYGNGGPPEARGYQSFRFDVPQGARFTGLNGTSADFLNSLGINYGYAAPAPVAPAPVYPQHGTVVDNGCTGHQDPLQQYFEWTPVAGATVYHLYVSREGSQNPALDLGNIPSNVFAQDLTSYVASHNTDGWSWSVRAFVSGQWGPWMADQSFSYEPPDTDCGGGARAGPGPQRYQIGIKTGTVSGAGTDANVWIKLRGSHAESGWLRLHDFVSGNPFENGDSDVFFVDFDPGLGELVAIALRNDGGGLGSDWYVEWVWAGFTGNQGRYFYVNQWLESGTATMWISP